MRGSTMFEHVFQDQRVLARHRNGPLAEERCRYLAYYAELGMARSRLQHIARYTLAIAETLRLAERPGELITEAEIDAEVYRRAVKGRKGGCSQIGSKGVAFGG